MNYKAAAPKEQTHGASRPKHNTIHIIRKALNKMTETMTLTGYENSSELMELRRSIVSARRNRQAAFLLTGTSRPEKDGGNIIRFPSPEYPLIA